MPGKRNQMKRAPRRPRRKTKTAKPGKQFAKKVMAVVNKASETKYVANDIQKTVPVDTYISIPSDLTTVMPVLQEGAGSWERVGNRINNVRGRTHFNFSIPYNTSSAFNWVVRLYMLTSKQSKAYPPSSLLANTLLDDGNGTTIDWDPTVTQVVTLSQRPLANENFSGKFKDFKLSKNSGSLNNDASTPPPSANGGHFPSNRQFTWNWSHKSALIYDEAGSYPTNFNPMFILVAFPYDNTTVTKEPTPILATIRTEMYYKDI